MKMSIYKYFVCVFILIASFLLISSTVLAQPPGPPYFTYTGSFSYDNTTHELTTTITTISLISYVDGTFAPNYYSPPFTVDDSLIGGTFTLGPLYNSAANSLIFGPSGGSIGDVSFSIDSGGTNYLTGTMDNFTVTTDEYGTRLNPYYDLAHVVNISTNLNVTSKFLDDLNAFPGSLGNLYMDFNFATGSGANDFTETSSGTISGEFVVAAVPADDLDGDGFGIDTDCDDTDATINPGAAEDCTDGIDNDCDDLVDSADPDAVNCPACTDNDIDGYAVEGGNCGPVDCDDLNPAVNPGAVEDCTDGIDNDCDNLVDTQDPDALNCPLICTDDDADGYAVEGGSCGPVDCDDLSPAVNPGAVEDCTDGIDNDCDNLVDTQDLDAMNCPLICTDNDIDGYAVEGGNCGPVDCNDVNSGINPGACDIKRDGIDQDCNGKDRRKGKACTGGGTGEPEICDDGIDNDGDGKTDCADKKDCKKDPAC